MTSSVGRPRPSSTPKSVGCSGTVESGRWRSLPRGVTTGRRGSRSRRRRCERLREGPLDRAASIRARPRNCVWRWLISAWWSTESAVAQVFGIPVSPQQYSQSEQRPLPGAYLPRTRRDYAMLGRTAFDPLRTCRRVFGRLRHCIPQDIGDPPRKASSDHWRRRFLNPLWSSPIAPCGHVRLRTRRSSGNEAPL
jgi:hypothetical protein